jgi:hypothetical protein
MPTEFDPKKLFQSDSAVAKELQAHRQDQWLLIGFSFTLSEMAFNGATESQLAGARHFIETFQNLWEKDEARENAPTKRIPMTIEDLPPRAKI